MKNLSIREIEVMKFTANGCTAKQIAKLTGLTHRTVEAYVVNIRKKLAAKNVAHAVFIASRRNYFD